MKIDLMFAKATDTAKLVRVVERMLRADVTGWTWKSTPRRLLAGLYVHYRNALLRQKELQRCVFQSGEYARKLEAEIKRLQDFEKQVKYAGYRAEVICHHWSCGDGCCSESWYSYKIFNQYGICEYEGDTNRDSGYWSLSDILRCVHDKYGNAISISEDDDYSREQ